ncbi:MAG: hypothetical protein Q9227_001832 [Pyrenula ochraceoflavens]
MPPAEKPSNYDSWEHADLVSRVQDLEQQLREQNAKYQHISTETPPLPTPSTSQLQAPPRRTAKPFESSRYNTRFIALKFMYFGQNYNGFEHANFNPTALPTIEEVLWKTLRKARLIWPPSDEPIEVIKSVPQRLKSPTSISWEGCQYSKCGRTDRGVNAFGQVIGIRVRSNRPRQPPRDVGNVDGEASMEQHDPTELDSSSDLLPGNGESNVQSNFDDVKDELPYISILNALLPSDIRILAWCPNPPSDFDARFSCRERRYKYFFTNPAFAPTPGPLGHMNQQGEKTVLREGWLDINAMRQGAKSLVGLHDFRNLCKIDPAKQMQNFLRRITYADIELVDQQSGPISLSQRAQADATNDRKAAEAAADDLHLANTAPQVFAFVVHGSAFLWHQVRCMAAILFLIGQGLEQPSLISTLLDIEQTPSRPNYEMVADSPLVLWDCIFPDLSGESMQDTLDWVYAGDERGIGSTHNKIDAKYGQGGLVDEIWQSWRKAKLDETLSATLLDSVIGQGDGTSWHRGGYQNLEVKRPRSQRIFDGREEPKLTGKYVPVLQKPRLEPVEVQNTKWLASKGARKLAKAKNQSSKESE